MLSQPPTPSALALLLCLFLFCIALLLPCAEAGRDELIFACCVTKSIPEDGPCSAAFCTKYSADVQAAQSLFAQHSVAAMTKELLKEEFPIPKSDTGALLQLQQKIKARQRARNPVVVGKLHKEGKIDYYFDPKIGQEFKKQYSLAINDWETNTCIRFQKVAEGKGVGLHSHPALSETRGSGTDTSDVYVSVTGKDIGGYVHELGHAIGLKHTHSRHDREDYLQVDNNKFKDMLEKDECNPKEIEHGRFAAFKEACKGVEEAKFGQCVVEKCVALWLAQYEILPKDTFPTFTEFDFSSVMMYAPNPDFMTIKKESKSKPIARSALTEADALSVNIPYGCQQAKFKASNRFTRWIHPAWTWDYLLKDLQKLYSGKILKKLSLNDKEVKSADPIGALKETDVIGLTLVVPQGDAWDD